MKIQSLPCPAKQAQLWLRFLVIALVLSGFDASVWGAAVGTATLTRVSGTVNAMLVNPADGTVVIGGAFSQIVADRVNVLTEAVVSSSTTACQNIVRLLSTGEVDPVFMAHLSAGTDREVESLALQSDGKVLVGGAFFRVGASGCSRIARLNTDGSVDTAFNPVADGDVMSIAVQPDGGVLLGGAFFTLNGAGHRRVGRLLSNGAVDSAFGADADGVVRAVALQSGSNIVVGGDFSNLNGVLRYHLGRLSPAGALDSVFNAGVDSVGGSAASRVNCLLVQADGKVLIGGAFSTLGTLARNNLARTGTDGTPDATFDPEADGPVGCLALQPSDGKILLGGQFGTVGGGLRPNFCRLNTDGSVDTVFNPRANGALLALAVQSDGTILAGGQFTQFAGQIYNAPGKVALAWVSGNNDSLSALRLNVPSPDPLTGSLTPSFSSSGTSYTVATNRHTLGVIPVCADPAATILVTCNGGSLQTVVSGTASPSFALATGSNSIAVTVVAGDGFTTRSYAIAATRSLSADATLSGLTLYGGTIRPTFAATGVLYQLTPTVSATEASGATEISGAYLRVHPVSNNPYASVLVQMDTDAAQTVGSGTSAPLLLRQGVNTINVLITAENGVATKTYVLTTGSAIPASTDADLRSLTVNAGTLNPVFGYSGTSYGTIVTGTSISVTSTFDNPNAAATVALNSGSALPMYSGQPSSSFALASDTNNQIVVTVTSEDWWTSGKSKTYTLNVYRIDAPVGRDPALGVSGVTLNSSVDKLVTTGGTCVFEYGKTAGYGQSVTAVRDVASPTAVSAALTGFETMPTYGVWHYRLTMFYGNAVYYGPDRTFTLSFPGTTPVAVTGDSVPGVSGAAFSSFGTPVVNGNGDVAFRATISGAGLAAGSNSLIWVESNPNGFLVARTGMAASAGVVSSLNSPAIDSQGAVAFLARTGSNTGLWASTSGALSLLACTQTFSQVPELVGGRFSAFSTVVLPDSGGPIFEASLAPRFGDVSTGNAKGLWRADSDDRLWTVVRSGEHDFIATNSGKVFREVLGPLPKTPAGRRQWIETEPNGHWTHAYSVDGRAHFAPAGWHDAMERPIPGVPPGCSRWIVLQDGRYDAVSGNVGMMFGPLPSAPKGSALWLASAKNNSWKWAFGSGKVKPAVASPWRVVWGPLSAPSAGTVHWALVNLDGRVTVVDRPAKLHSPAVLDSFEAFSPTAEVSGQKRSFNRFGEVVLATAFADKTARIVHVDPSLVRTVVRSAGSVAPDVAKGTFSLFYQPAINDLNHLAFRAILSGSGITAENHAGIWADFGRFHKLVARTGASAPGVHHGVFGELNDPLFNNADQVAFVGTLRTGPGGVTKANASGLWMTRMEGKSRALRLVARERSTAVPGYPAGVYFSTFQRIALLESGRVVLLATLTGNVASADGYGIWATDAAGQLRLIARKGGGLMVDGVGKTIVALSILTGSGETVGQTRGFNDTGEIVYLASFSDGSHGIFRARVD